MIEPHPQDKAKLPQRFWDKIELREPPAKTHGTVIGYCWHWTAGIDNGGYARFSFGDEQFGHRTAYLALIGPIPSGLHLDHLCENRRCVNPVHLQPITQRENVLLGDGPAALNARKTHCKRGHELSGDNLRIAPDGSRQCRQCAAWHQRKKSETAAGHIAMQTYQREWKRQNAERVNARKREIRWLRRIFEESGMTFDIKKPVVIVTVSPEGDTKVEAFNITGSGCQALTKGIEQALGATTGDKRKPEFLQSANQAAKATH